MASRWPVALLLIVLQWGCSDARDQAREIPLDGNRLAYLDSDSPYYPSKLLPKLTTPQWIGEEGVDAVIVLSIDDLREKSVPTYEKFLRPILDRLKQIDGRAALAIMSNTFKQEDPQLQTWLQEGVSLDAHTTDHPCPLLKNGDFNKAKTTFDSCIDALSNIPGNKPVAFRFPCCDSRNTPSPRAFAEIFNGVTPLGRFLTIDSSVFNIPTASDPEVSRELVLEPDGRERFRKYLPFENFVNTIEDYPYPYIINRLCWELPISVPSDWEAQNLNRPFSPISTADWKAAIDATVQKKGVFTLCFHPHNWSSPQQIIELIDYATSKYGKRIKFLNFREVNQRLEKNLCAGVALRNSKGQENGVRLLDLNNDGYMDVVIGSGTVRKSRVWSPTAGKWIDSGFPADLSRGDVHFGLIDGPVLLQNRNGTTAAWRFDRLNWSPAPELLIGLPKELLAAKNTALRLPDIDGDGSCELICEDAQHSAICRWDASAKMWQRAPFTLPAGTNLVDSRGRDAGLRFVDVNEDGRADVVFSSEDHFGIYLFHSMQDGWSKVLREGKSGDKDALPPIVRGGANNGFWAHSRRLWWQNEQTAQLENLVEVRHFNDLNQNSEPTAKSPAASLACIHVTPGYRVEMVAKEPVVQDPICFAWGPSGKFFVVEMGDYPLGTDGKGTPGGHVKLLQDGDGDGVYEKSTIFVDKLPFPTAVMAWRKGILVASAPEILYFEDSDGDGIADKREVLFTGFKEGNQQHRLNGFYWGLDNWIYGANGDSGGEVKSVKTGQVTSISGRDFRFRPDTGEFEAVTGQTQYGRCRNDWNDWFGCNNTNPIFHYPLEERYLKRNPHVPHSVSTLRADVPEIPGSTPVNYISRMLPRFNDPHTAGHFTSASAVWIYRDDLLFARGGSSLAGTPPVGAWVADAPAKEQPPRTLTALGREVAAGDIVIVSTVGKNAFDPASTRNLHVSAAGEIQLAPRERLKIGGLAPADAAAKIIEWLRDRPDAKPGYVTVQIAPSAPGRLEETQILVAEPVHDLVNRQTMVRNGFTFTSHRLPIETTSEFFASSDNWARPVWVGTGPDGALYISDMYRIVIEHPQWIPKEWQAKLDLRAGHDLGRIYRVLPVGTSRRDIPDLEKLDTPALVKVLESPSGWRRDMAQQILLWRGDPTAIPLLAALFTESSDPRARLHALCTLDGLGAVQPAMLERALRDAHPALRRHALRIGERRLGTLAGWSELLSRLENDEPQVRLQLAYALGYWNDARAAQSLARLATDADADRFLIAAVLSSITAENVDAIAELVARRAQEAAPEPVLLSGLIRTAVGCGKPQAIGMILSTTATPRDGKLAVWQLKMLGNLLDALDQANLSLGKLAASGLKDAKTKVDAAITSARALAQDEKAPLDLRCPAVVLLGREQATRQKDSALLAKLLAPQLPSELRRAVVTSLTRRRDAAALGVLIEQWKQLTPDLRNATLDAILTRTDWIMAMFDAIEKKQILPAEIDPARRHRLSVFPNGKVRDRTAEVLGAAADSNRQKVIDAYAEKIKTLQGDLSRGKAVFNKACATCHRFAGMGKEVGPELAAVGDKSTQGLTIAILDPNRAVMPRYVNYIANTDDEVYTGILAGETGTSITLLDADAKAQTILRSELRSLKSSNSSLMPEGLEAQISPQELIDLITFIKETH